MNAPKFTIRQLLIVIALLAVILYCGMLFVKSYIWMINAGW